MKYNELHLNPYHNAKLFFTGLKYAICQTGNIKATQ